MQLTKNVMLNNTIVNLLVIRDARGVLSHFNLFLLPVFGLPRTLRVAVVHFGTFGVKWTWTNAAEGRTDPAARMEWWIKIEPEYHAWNCEKSLVDWPKTSRTFPFLLLNYIMEFIEHSQVILRVKCLPKIEMPWKPYIVKSEIEK